VERKTCSYFFRSNRASTLPCSRTARPPHLFFSTSRACPSSSTLQTSRPRLPSWPHPSCAAAVLPRPAAVLTLPPRRSFIHQHFFSGEGRRDGLDENVTSPPPTWPWRCSSPPAPVFARLPPPLSAEPHVPRHHLLHRRRDMRLLPHRCSGGSSVFPTPLRRAAASSASRTLRLNDVSPRYPRLSLASHLTTTRVSPTRKQNASPPLWALPRLI
jgi:hypothetical protein